MDFENNYNNKLLKLVKLQSYNYLFQLINVWHQWFQKPQHPLLVERSTVKNPNVGPYSCCFKTPVYLYLFINVISTKPIIILTQLNILTKIENPVPWRPTRP